MSEDKKVFLPDDIVPDYSMSEEKLREELEQQAQETREKLKALGL